MILDNTLWSGRVVDPAKNDENTNAIRALNERVRDDPRRRTCCSRSVTDERRLAGVIEPGVQQQRGPVGHTRSIGLSILWAVLTLGIYTFIWTYKTQEEIKRHSGNGVGGVIGLVIYILIGRSRSSLSRPRCGTCTRTSTARRARCAGSTASGSCSR